MRKFILPLAFLFSTPLLACDVCPCIPGGGMSGIFPQYRKHFAGIRYQYRAFNYPETTGDPMLHEKLTWHSADLMMRFTYGEKTQFMVSVPMLSGKYEIGKNSFSNKGIGDLSLQANYFLINTNNSGGSVKQFLSAGAGLKLPTGKYNKEGVSGNLQTGTGAFDLLAYANYIVRKGSAGVMTDLTFRNPLPNPLDYQLGRRITTNAKLFYWKAFNATNSLVPNISGAWEYAAKDVSKNYYVANTGGNSFIGGVGADYFLNNLSFSFQLQYPLKVNQQAINPGKRIQGSLIYYF